MKKAARELGTTPREVRRASAIASMPEPVKQEAREAGIDPFIWAVTREIECD